MNRTAFHLSNEQLLRQVDGESTAREEKAAEAHLQACWTCRARKQELEAAISDFVHVHEREFESKLPSADGPRALLKAQMARLADEEVQKTGSRPKGFGWLAAVAACGLLTFVLVLAVSGLRWQSRLRPQQAIFSSPDAKLTPGAAVLLNRQQLCSQTPLNNKDVPEWMRRQVFQEYGIASAEPNAYEVDYLITPALGGADDIRNLWPHSHQETIWNSGVKDKLENRLRQMVCDGSLDLTAAQQQIAGNWIATYKYYFHTDKPLGPGLQ